MTTKQKVRVARKFARKMIDHECIASRDLGAFHSPLDCWNLIVPGMRRQVANFFEKLGLSPLEFHDEMRVYIEKEAQFDREGLGPMAFYEWCELEGLMD